MTLSLIVLLSPVSAITSSQGPYLEKDVNFRSKTIHYQVEQAIQGKLVEPTNSNIEFKAEPFKINMSMKF